MSTFVAFRDSNFTNEEGAGKILAKIVGQSVVVGAETSHRVEEKGAGADDTVDVQVGEVIIIDDDGYALGAWSDAIENLPVTSNSSGNPRIDIVVAYIDKAVEDNSNNNSPGGLVFAIVDGTPAGAPTPPNDATIQAAVGADNPFIKLAQIEVADSFVSITNSEITDLREQLSIQSGGKKLQYNVATNTWELEDTLGVDTINEKTPAAGVTIDGVLLKDGLVWTSWTPTWTNLDIGKATLNYAKFIQIGKTVHFRLKLTMTANTPISGAVSFSLPIDIHSDLTDTDVIQASVMYVETGQDTYPGTLKWLSSSTVSLNSHVSSGTFTNLNTVVATGPFTWGNTDEISVSGTYEVD